MKKLKSKPNGAAASGRAAQTLTSTTTTDQALMMTQTCAGDNSKATATARFLGAEGLKPNVKVTVEVQYGLFEHPNRWFVEREANPPRLQEFLLPYVEEHALDCEVAVMLALMHPVFGPLSHLMMEETVAKEVTE